MVAGSFVYWFLGMMMYVGLCAMVVGAAFKKCAVVVRRWVVVSKGLSVVQAVSSMGVCVVVCNGCWAAFKTSAVVVGRCLKLGSLC